MFDRRTTTTLLAVLLVVSAAVPIATATVSRDRSAAATGGPSLSASGSGYAGSHVSFDVSEAAILDYQVDDVRVFEKVSVQSQSQARSELGLALGADLAAVTDFNGTALGTSGQADTSVRFTADSGGSVRAHDNSHGSLVVAAESGAQYVGLDIGADANAQSTGDGTVIVQNEGGSETAILVAGEGSVTVNEAGNVTAELESESHLVVRTYESGRSEAAKAQEDLITAGKAAAQVYVESSAQGSSETAADVVDYGQETSVEVTQQAEGSLEMTVERSAHQGKVVITTISNATFDGAEDVGVTVDGEAAARASSTSELKTATNGGETSKFVVEQSNSAEASTDVLVGLNHFSARTVGIQDADAGTDGSNSTDRTDAGDGSDGSDGADETTTTSSSGPGFGLVLGLLALIGAGLLAVRRH